jgi:hypothetical protein
MRSETMAKMNETIETMLNQFGGPVALRMVGAKNCVYDNAKNSIGFTFMRNASQATFCELRYDNAEDAYCMTFRTRAGRETKSFEGVYCDELARTFSEYTGLALRLPRIVGINA